MLRPLSDRCRAFGSCRRLIFQETKTWEQWSDAVRPAVERHWFPRVAELDRRMNEETGWREKCYVLSMFPYPSGRLHMGHLRVYTVTDVLARWQRLRGKFVVQPMGWDAFGLPAENAALERGLAPATWTRNNIQAMKEQLMNMGLSLDWSRELATCDPSYYRWTQWLFLKLHEHDLTYQRRAVVNWDPVDRTVLADELVDEQGRSWRSGAVVEKRMLRQWFFRTTAYSQSLLEGLETIEGKQWRDVVRRQRGWIGRLSGTAVEFDVKDSRSGRLLPDRLSVFTEVPAALFGVSFVLVTADHALADPGPEAGGDVEALPLRAVHPVTAEELPVLRSRSLTFRAEECLDARLGVPALSETDRGISERFQCAHHRILDGRGLLANSRELDGMTVEEGNCAARDLLRHLGRGGHLTSSLRTDWLVSRQRFWGTPIPIVHCAGCGAVPVPERDLPVRLPESAASGGRTVSPLADLDGWRRTRCPRCGGDADRETDTMDTFVDSAWYFLRFLDSRNSEKIFDPDVAHRLMPVDIYVGGIEHAIRHLFYARFISHFLYDIGLLPQKEPFIQFLPIGLVMGKTFQVKRTGKYLAANEVGRDADDALVEAATGEPVLESWDKMSKSKHNGTDPEAVIARLGVETTRLCMLANTGPHKGRKWQEDSVLLGVVNWQRRLWALVGEVVSGCRGQPLGLPTGADPLAADPEFAAAHDRCLAKAVRAYERTFVLSGAVASLQRLTDLLLRVPPDRRLASATFAGALCDLVVLASPLAPMFASELWSGLQWALAARPPARYDLSRPVQMQRFAWTPDHGADRAAGAHDSH